MPRPDGRLADQLRPLSFERDYTEMAAGSVLVSFGRTRVLCTASIDENVPRWMKGKGKGWVTAEYSMLPGASPERIDREAAKGKQSGRTVEIQRLIGRSLRAACDMKALGERQVVVDCDVLQADGGTRTASICGGYVALHDALQPAGRQPLDLPSPAALGVCGDQRRDRRRRARSRSALCRGLRSRGRHERRHAPARRKRRAAVRRGPGHRRRGRFLAGAARRAGRSRRGRAASDLRRPGAGARSSPAPRTLGR